MAGQTHGLRNPVLNSKVETAIGQCLAETRPKIIVQYTVHYRDVLRTQPPGILCSKAQAAEVRPRDIAVVSSLDFAITNM